MRFQYVTYIWPLLISAFATILLGLYALIRQRHSKCAASFISSMFIVTVWSCGNALEMSGADFPTKLFWADIQYFAYCYSPPALLALCMRFTGYDKWLRNKKYLWLLLLPTVIVFLVWTDGLHGLMRYNMHMDYGGAFPVIAKSYGAAFYIHAAYEHIINIVALIMLVRAVIYRKTVYRKQTVILLAGASLIVFPNLLYILGLSSVSRFDLTPVFFGPAGALMAWAIFRYKMFDLVPFARATVIETMDTGMMVLDLRGRILDINPAFERYMEISVKQATGREADELFKGIPEFAAACADKSVTHIEFLVGTRVYEAAFSSLTGSGEALFGRLALVAEVTEKKKEQQLQLEQQRRLAAAHEKERMTRDLHDNLGQILGFINLQAQGIRQELVNAGVDSVSERLDRLVEVTQTAHNEMRTYIKSARGISSTDGDILQSLQNDILRFEEHTGITMELETDPDLTDIALVPQVKYDLLSIVKEALNNVLKHSGATHVKVKFSLTGRMLCLSIEDNGRGFDVSSIGRERKSFGLKIMRERASEIGAEFSVEAKPGGGCKIIVSLSVSQGGRDSVEDYAGG